MDSRPDDRLLTHYNLELQYLKELGAEFAQEFPKIASRLGMTGMEVADPYVERLLEGVAFLAARVQLKLDAEFPRLTQALLDIVQPHFLRPTPSMVVAQLRANPNEKDLALGVTVPRGSAMLSLLAADDVTECEFRTAHDVTLWPIEIGAASYFTYAPDLALNALPVAQPVRAGLRIKLRTTGGLIFQQMALDRLTFFVTGRDAHKIYELCQAAALGVAVLPTPAQPRHAVFSPAAAIRRVGFDDSQALLPVGPRAYEGYRLLREYFAFPQRFRFFEITNLADAVRQADGGELDIIIPLSRGDQTLENIVSAANFRLYCTPAINLFPKRADPIQVTDSTHEFHVVPDRTRPMDFEVYDVEQVIGHGVGAESEQTFDPLYASPARSSPRQRAYFTTRREIRRTSTTQEQRGPRSSYLGTEVFLSLVDREQTPYSSDLRQLSVVTWCTNRDLVLNRPWGRPNDCALNEAPVAAISVSIVEGPTRPHAPLVEGEVAWRAINHLSLNYLSLVDATPETGAATLRHLLQLYVPAADVAGRRQVDQGLRSVRVDPVVRRLPGKGPLAFGRGLQITVDVDETAFEGASAFLLGAVLDRYFSRHVSINSFIETVLRSQAHGEINRWMPQWGVRATL